MNKVIIGAVILVIVGGGAWYFTRGRAGTMMPGSPQSGAFSGTLAEAMKLGVPMQCSWQSDKTSGESFVKGSDAYIETKMDGKTGHMLKKGDCFYTWSDDPASADKGFKFCQQPSASSSTDNSFTPPTNGSTQAEGVDWNVKYSCHPAVLSGDKFNVPANIQFPDIQEMMKGYLPSAMPSIPAQLPAGY